MPQQSPLDAQAGGAELTPQQSPPYAQARPLLSVLRGEPTADDLAAVTVVLAAISRRAAQQTASRRRPGSAWSASERMFRPHVFAGPGAWRASGLPR
jgi:hypothetical protein